MRISSLIQPKHSSYKGIDWFALFADGNPKGFAHFFDLQYPGLFLSARKMLRDEGAARKIVICAYADAWNNREAFTSQEQLKQFVRETVKNKCTTYRLSPPAIGVADGPPDWESKGPHMERIHKEILAEMFGKLDQLPKDTRLILHQAVIERMSLAQLAAEWNISENAAAIRKSRAFKTLLSLLADPGNPFIHH
ncbi:MAG TPA: sigma-70 family RNA polymerase sigma factor [Puia sp.]|jgi:RNA polymerase sigma factor (sigma-70 family)